MLGNIFAYSLVKMAAVLIQKSVTSLINTLRSNPAQSKGTQNFFLTHLLTHLVHLDHSTIISHFLIIWSIKIIHRVWLNLSVLANNLTQAPFAPAS